METLNSPKFFSLVGIVLGWNKLIRNVLEEYFQKIFDVIGGEGVF